MYVCVYVLCVCVCMCVCVCVCVCFPHLIYHKFIVVRCDDGTKVMNRKLCTQSEMCVRLAYLGQSAYKMLLIGNGLHGKSRTCPEKGHSPEKGQSTQKPCTVWDRLQVIYVRYRTDCTRRLGGKGQGAPDLSVPQHIRPTLNERNEEVHET